MILPTKKRIRLKELSSARWHTKANPTRLWLPVGALSAAVPNFGEKG